MNEMVERGSRAIDAQILASKKAFAARSGQIRAILDAIPWERQPESYREECRMIARAVIMVMREPSNNMTIAGFSGVSDENMTRKVWRAMIDEALK